ncbi:hypothetical protein GCM10009117_00970 [Gangjinia marincola]|uniref:Uncharacterized protein n=1 Tax=Gangjinia marincola TaxID=578463 RepID=A0ABN1MCX7_9FLAO
MFNAINDDVSYFDVIEIWYIIPVIIIIVPLVYFIRVKVFNPLDNMSSEELEKELSVRNTIWDSFKDLFR